VEPLLILYNVLFVDFALFSILLYALELLNVVFVDINFKFCYTIGMESEIAMQQNNKKKRDRRQWTDSEDEALLDILIEAVNKGHRCDNGQFKAHTLRMAETKLEEKFPTCGIKVKPHIESAMKRLRSIYAIIYDMVNQSGFGWDEEKKMIKVESDEVWKDYVKVMFINFILLIVYLGFNYNWFNFAIFSYFSFIC
jgi:hypothetical protein